MTVKTQKTVKNAPDTCRLCRYKS